MSKIEVTDEMVEMAARKICENSSTGHTYGCSLKLGPKRCFCGYYDERVKCARAVLEAALNPPPEPEVEVTEEMAAAGVRTYHNAWNGNAPLSSASLRGMRAAYRAMYAARPKESDITKQTTFMHIRSADFGDGFASGPHYHRRKDDPR